MYAILQNRAATVKSGICFFSYTMDYCLAHLLFVIGIIWCGFEISVFIFFVFFYTFFGVCFYFAALTL